MLNLHKTMNREWSEYYAASKARLRRWKHTAKSYRREVQRLRGFNSGLAIRLRQAQANVETLRAQLFHESEKRKAAESNLAALRSPETQACRHCDRPLTSEAR